VTDDLLVTSQDEALADTLTDNLVAYNKERSAAVRERFLPENLRAEPVQAYLLDDQRALVGGCTGRVERLWHWLTIDLMWVDERRRGGGVGAALLSAVEDQARALGCRWAEVTTFDFQAPGFYEARGYVEYAVKHDYPPGHRNHLLRKDL